VGKISAKREVQSRRQLYQYKIVENLTPCDQLNIFVERNPPITSFCDSAKLKELREELIARMLQILRANFSQIEADSVLTFATNTKKPTQIELSKKHKVPQTKISYLKRKTLVKLRKLLEKDQITLDLLDGIAEELTE